MGAAVGPNTSEHISTTCRPIFTCRVANHARHKKQIYIWTISMVHILLNVLVMDIVDWLWHIVSGISAQSWS